MADLTVSSSAQAACLAGNWLPAKQLAGWQAAGCQADNRLAA